MFGQSPKPSSSLLIAFLSVGAVACDASYRTFAPRHPGAPRPPTSVSNVQVLITGRPTCDYEVIGTVFTRAAEGFAEAAAAAGGDGVYDSECDVRAENHQLFVPDEKALRGPAIPGRRAPSSAMSFNTSTAECAARVFVCKGRR